MPAKLNRVPPDAPGLTKIRKFLKIKKEFEPEAWTVQKLNKGGFLKQLFSDFWK